MPLLVIAVITHVIYRWAAETLGWTRDTSSRAWAASMAHSREAAERISQRARDLLDRWEDSTGARSYLAYGLKLGGRTVRGVGRAGVWTALASAKATGAVFRAVAGGTVITGGLLGALAQATRNGARAGSQWWSAHPWSQGAGEWTSRMAERLNRWGSTVQGEVGADSEIPPAEPNPDPEPDPTPEAEVPEPEVAEPDDPLPPIKVKSYVFTGHEPRVTAQPEKYTSGYDGHDLSSISAGEPQATSVAVIERPASAPEGAPVTIVANHPGSAVAPSVPGALGQAGSAVAVSGPTGDQVSEYQLAVKFFDAQVERTGQLADIIEQINALQAQAKAIAQLLATGHEMAAGALASYGVTAPNLGDALSLMAQVAGDPAPEAQMLATFTALDVFRAACYADQANLVGRFGHLEEAVAAEGIDPTWLNRNQS